MLQPFIAATFTNFHTPYYITKDSAVKPCHAPWNKYYSSNKLYTASWRRGMTFQLLGDTLIKNAYRTDKEHIPEEVEWYGIVLGHTLFCYPRMGVRTSFDAEWCGFSPTPLQSFGFRDEEWFGQFAHHNTAVPILLFGDEEAHTRRHIPYFPSTPTPIAYPDAHRAHYPTHSTHPQLVPPSILTLRSATHPWLYAPATPYADLLALPNPNPPAFHLHHHVEGLRRALAAFLDPDGYHPTEPDVADPHSFDWREPCEPLALRLREVMDTTPMRRHDDTTPSGAAAHGTDNRVSHTNKPVENLLTPSWRYVYADPVIPMLPPVRQIDYDPQTDTDAPSMLRQLLAEPGNLTLARNVAEDFLIWYVWVWCRHDKTNTVPGVAKPLAYSETMSQRTPLPGRPRVGDITPGMSQIEAAAVCYSRLSALTDVLLCTTLRTTWDSYTRQRELGRLFNTTTPRVAVPGWGWGVHRTAARESKRANSVE